MKNQKDFAQHSFLEVKLDLLGMPTPYKRNKQSLSFLLRKAYQQHYPEIIKFNFEEYMDYMKYFLRNRSEAFNELKTIVENFNVMMGMNVRGSYSWHREFIFKFRDDKIEYSPDRIEFLDKCYVKCVPELVKVAFYCFLKLDNEMEEWYNGQEMKKKISW